MHKYTPLLIENSPNKCYNFIFIIAPTTSGLFYGKRRLSMSKAQNEIEEFIYKICYRPIWESVNNCIATHPTTLNLSMSHIKYPDNSMLLDMLLEYATHIHISEDFLFFDALLSCTIELQQFNEYRGDMSGETSQWLIASCKAVIIAKLETLTVSFVKPWSKDTKPSSTGVAASKIIVPIIYRKNRDKEATTFLEKFIRKNLKNRSASRLKISPKRNSVSTSSRDIVSLMSSSSSARSASYDLFKASEKEQEVPRGTILIDAMHIPIGSGTAAV